jgi:hypothetical protein
MIDSDRRPVYKWRPILKCNADVVQTWPIFIMWQGKSTHRSSFWKGCWFDSNKSAIDLRIWKGRWFENNLKSDRQLSWTICLPLLVLFISIINVTILQLTVKLLSHNAVSCTHHQSGIQTHVGDDTHRLHICKSNYHTITTTTVVSLVWALVMSSQTLWNWYLLLLTKHAFLRSKSKYRVAQIQEWSGVPVENHWSATSHWQTLSLNVVSSTPYLSRVQIYNVSANRHWLHI